MTLVRDGHVLYRLRFIGRPDLDSNDFDSLKAYEVGENFSADELVDNWIVCDVLHSPDGERDTLNLTIQEAV